MGEEPKTGKHFPSEGFYVIWTQSLWSTDSSKSSSHEKTNFITLRKSSSDGLLRNLFSRTASTSAKEKTQGSKDQANSNRSDLNSTRGEEDFENEKINKAFRTSTGPLILVPQKRSEDKKSKRDKGPHNVGIQQISHQQAALIIKDHKKLKETLFSETSVNSKGEKKRGQTPVQDDKKPLADEATGVKCPSPSLVGEKEFALNDGKHPLSASLKETNSEQVLRKSSKETTGSDSVSIPEQSKEEKETHFFSFKSSKKQLTRELEDTKASKEKKGRHTFSLSHSDKKKPLKDPDSNSERHVFNLSKSNTHTSVKEDLTNQLKRGLLRSSSTLDETSIKGIGHYFTKKDQPSPGVGVNIKEPIESLESGRPHKERHIFGFATKDKSSQINKAREKAEGKECSPPTPIGGDKAATRELETNVKSNQQLLISFKNNKEIKKEPESNKDKERKLLNFIADKRDSFNETSKASTEGLTLNQEVIDVKDSSKKLKEQDKHFFRFSSGEKKVSNKQIDNNATNKNLSTPYSAAVDKGVVGRTLQFGVDKQYSQNSDLNIVDNKELVKKVVDVNKTNTDPHITDDIEVHKKKVTNKLLDRGKPQQIPLSHLTKEDNNVSAKVPEVVSKDHGTVDRKVVEDNKGKQFFRFPGVVHRISSKTDFDTNTTRDQNQSGIPNTPNAPSSKNSEATLRKKERNIFNSIANFKSKPPIAPKLSLTREAKVSSPSAVFKSSLSSDSKVPDAQKSHTVSITEIQASPKGAERKEVSLSKVTEIFQEPSFINNIIQSSRAKSYEDVINKQYFPSSPTKSTPDSKKLNLATTSSSQNTSKNTERFISEELSNDLISSESKTGDSSILEPSVQTAASAATTETSINADDKWYKIPPTFDNAGSQDNLKGNSGVRRHKNIRENQEKKIQELHQKHLAEITKLRSIEAANLERINRPVSLTEQTSAHGVLPNQSPVVDSSKNNSFNSTLPEETSQNLLESIKQDTLYCYGSSLTNNDKKYQNTEENSKQTLENLTKSLPRKLSENQPYSFSSYLIKNRRDSLGDKDKPAQAKPPEEKPVPKVELPKKVHFPDEVQSPSIDNPPLVDEKLSRASITNESQAADLVDFDLLPQGCKESSKSILKKTSTSKDENKNEVGLRSSEENLRTSVTTDTIIPNNVEVRASSSYSSFQTIPTCVSTTATGDGPLISAVSAEDPYLIPSRPPRGEKPKRIKRSHSASDAMRYLMSDQRIAKDKIPKDLNQNKKTGSNQAKGPNPSPSLPHAHAPTQRSPQHSRHPPPSQDETERNPNGHRESFKKPSQVHKQILQHLPSEIDLSEVLGQQDREPSTHHARPTDQEISQRAEGKEDKRTVEPSSPQPPTRGNKHSGKPHFEASEKPPSTEENKVDPILVTACRVAEEDQILKLVRDLTKTCRLDAGFINQIDNSGRSALSHACSNGFARVVEYLTSQPDIDLNHVDIEGNTPLHYAAQGGHVEIVSHLVNTCNRQVDLDVRNSLGFTPLMKAALQGRTKIAKILLFAGASPLLRDFGRGFCAMEWAKYTGRENCWELIESVQRSCSSHIKDRWTSDPEFKLSHSGSNSSLSHCQYSSAGGQDHKDSWLKHKIKKVFDKSESKKEFSVATNLSTLAQCVSTPILPYATVPPEPTVPKVQVTEVLAPDCYMDPEMAESPINLESPDKSASDCESTDPSSPETPQPSSKIPSKKRGTKSGGSQTPKVELNNS